MDNNKIPNIDNLWHYLRDKRYFTVLDFNNGFFHISLEEDSKKYTAIVANGEQFLFQVLPMGLSISLSIYQAIMTEILADILYEKCLVYVDDIRIFGETFEETLEITELILQRLNKIGLVEDQEVQVFPGHTIRYNQIGTLNKHTNAIREMKPPRTLRQLRLGLAGYYRKFISNFSSKCLPLIELNRGLDAKTNLKIELTSKHQEVFEDLKKALINKAVLAFYNENAKMFLSVDASKYLVGAGLEQVDVTKGEIHLVGYFSQVLKPIKRCLCSFDLENISNHQVNRTF